MATRSSRNKTSSRKPSGHRRERGMPGDGAGRTETPGRSGVYPVSSMQGAGEQAKIAGEKSWGQGERGEAGYEDSGGSELSTLDVEATGGTEPRERRKTTQ